MIKIEKILSNSRLAFQAGLVSRALGLFFFTICIARRWSIGEIALFESFSLFQYLVFFTWFPAWGIVTLRQGTNENKAVQKSFLFSNLVFSVGFLLIAFSITLFGPSFFSIWSELSSMTWVGILVYMIFYLIGQGHVYMNYANDKTRQQWLYAVLNFVLWLVLAFCTDDFSEFITYFIIVSGILSFMQLLEGWSFPFRLHKDFWKEVAGYSIYLTIGAATVVIAGYYVLQRYGLNMELNWFRYGSRELPILPAVLVGFGQSFLIQKSDLNPAAALKQGLPRYLLLLSPLILIILCSTPLYAWLYGIAFIPAATLMSTYLLIYIPRVIQSNIILQALDDRKSLLWIGVVEFIFVMLAILLLAPQGELMLVIWILVFGTLFEKVMQIVVLKYKHQVNMTSYIPEGPFIIWTILLLLAYTLHLLFV